MPKSAGGLAPGFLGHHGSKGVETVKIEEYYQEFCARVDCADIPALTFFTFWQRDAQHYPDPDMQLSSWVVWWQAGRNAWRDGVKASAIAAGYRSAAVWVRLLAWEAAQDGDALALPEGVQAFDLSRTGPEELHNVIGRALGEID